VCRALVSVLYRKHRERRGVDTVILICWTRLTCRANFFVVSILQAKSFELRSDNELMFINHFKFVTWVVTYDK
jgi:hypothetical protein